MKEFKNQNGKLANVSYIERFKEFMCNYYIENKFEEDIKVIYLFYNNYED
jgi:hypothetical protein